MTQDDLLVGLFPPSKIPLIWNLICINKGCVSCCCSIVIRIVTILVEISHKALETLVFHKISWPPRLEKKSVFFHMYCD